MRLSDPISSVQGIGPKLSEEFNKREVYSVKDLLFYLPRKYDDFSHVIKIHDLSPGMFTIKARISSITNRRGRRGLSITEALASDDTDSIKVVWFNQPYRKDSIKPNQEYYISGVYKLSHRQFSLINPSIELISDVPLNSARIVPVYRESKQLNSNLIRRLISLVLPLCTKIHDPLPEDLIKQLALMTLGSAIAQAHFPQTVEKLNLAKQRLAYDDLFPILLANALTKQELMSQKSIKVKFDLTLAKQFVAKLPFKLTDDQRKTIWQIYQDMQSDTPMNRLVEGDVGSGKTVVCVMSAVMAMRRGYSVAFMAPTELLARQHAETVIKLLTPLELADKLILLTGSMSQKQKQVTIQRANKIKGSFIVGTHSLLTSSINWSKLALLIIDEQHRFGVDQRQQLQRRAGHLPHCLSITATPIPRSLALTLLNDLSLSRIHSMPDSRRQIETTLISPSSTTKFFTRLKQELADGRQAYVVCPIIHALKAKESYSLEQVYKEMQVKLKGFSVGFIHGQLDALEQTKTMQAFLDNKINVLVATSVIEVGVDVANASVIAIYAPERFGLAQLHQLRGRVGRSYHKSYCFLMLSDSLDPSPRLKQFALINDGFELSELDLSLRGPGAIYGKMQHGKHFSSFFTLSDRELVSKAYAGVDYFLLNPTLLLECKELYKQAKAAQQLTYLN